MVNWTFFAINDLLATIIMFILFFVVMFSHIKTKYRHLVFLSLLFLSVGTANLLFTLANLYLSFKLFAAFIILMSVEVLFSCLFVDYVCRERIDPIKLSVWALLSGMMIISAFDFEKTYYLLEYPDGVLQISYNQGILQILFMVMSIFWAILLIYLSLRIYFEVPRQLKKQSLTAFFAIILIVIRGIFAYQFNLISPIINTLLLIAGFGFLTVHFIKYPELAFVVPFKTLHFNILNAKSGLSIFSYSWRENSKTPMINNTIFSGLCTGLDVIFKTTIQKGNIHEIHLEKAVLLIQRSSDSPIMFILIATKASRSLRKALKAFTQRFAKEFASEIEEIDSGFIDKSKFWKANDLLSEFFPFIPDYVHEDLELLK